MDLHLHHHFLLEGGEVPLIILCGYLMITVMAILSVTSMVTVFLLLSSLCSILGRAGSMKSLFLISIPKMSTRGVLITTLKLIIKTYILKTMPSRRVHNNGYELRNHRWSLYLIMSCFTLGWQYEGLCLNNNLPDLMLILLLGSETIGVCNVNYDFYLCMSDILLPAGIILICVIHFHNIDMANKTIHWLNLSFC